MKTVFTRVLGNRPTIRILDLLLEGREFDYSISDIAQATKVNRATIKKILNLLIEEGFVVKTRIMGKSQLYKINLKNPEVGKLFEFYETLLRQQEESIETEEDKMRLHQKLE